MAWRPKKNKGSSSNNAEYYKNKGGNVDDDVYDHDHIDIPKPPPVYILPEPELSCNPRLLSEDVLQQLIDEGVPECLHLNAWERIFSMMAMPLTPFFHPLLCYNGPMAFYSKSPLTSNLPYLSYHYRSVSKPKGKHI